VVGVNQFGRASINRSGRIGGMGRIDEFAGSVVIVHRASGNRCTDRGKRQITWSHGTPRESPD
jgi:hypothetical protein